MAAYRGCRQNHEDGFIYIVDRVKDMRFAAERTHSSEVETVLFQVEAIAECSVWGPDDRLGEEVGAAIYLHPGASETALIRSFAGTLMAKHRFHATSGCLTARCPEMPTASF